MTNSKGELTKEFFIFLKYNKILDKEPELLESDRIIFEDFVAKFKKFSEDFKNGSEDAIVDFMSLTTMFGFNRHYCSMTGKPIIGKYFKIGKKIVSREAYESYKIIREMEKGKTKSEDREQRKIHTTSNNQPFKKH